MKNEIAIIIPTFNQKEIVLETVKLLKEQTAVPDIIVVDNNSDDFTAEEIRKNHPDIIVLKARGNFGSSGGQYIGARYAYEKGYDWIVLSDNDAHPVSPNLIDELVRNASENIVTQPFNRYGKEHNSTIFSLHYGCYSRSVFENVGFPLFDFFLFGDDEEYSRRLRKAGIKIKKLEDVFYFHPMKRTFAPARFYFFHRNILNVRFFYDKKLAFLFRSIAVLESLIVYKIMGEKDCYFYGLQGVKYFLKKNYDNSYIKKTSKYFSPLISSDIEAFRKENTNAFVNVSQTTNNFLKMESLRGKVNNLNDFLKIVRAKKMITESINGFEAMLCSFLFNNSLIAIENIDSDKVEYRKYIFYSFPKRYFFLLVGSILHINLFFLIFTKSIFGFRKNNLGSLNKEYDRKILSSLLKKYTENPR